MKLILIDKEEILSEFTLNDKVAQHIRGGGNINIEMGGLSYEETSVPLPMMSNCRVSIDCEKD